MSRPSTVLDVADESEFTALAGRLARAWQSAVSGALLIGLSGVLGAGKTTWVRGMLAGLGYIGRVPSPTYTLLEHYRVEDLDIVHVDLYRLGGRGVGDEASAEIETLGLREWLARDRCWVLVEWPERAPALEHSCDLRVDIAPMGASERRIQIALAAGADEALMTSLGGLSELRSS